MKNTNFLQLKAGNTPYAWHVEANDPDRSGFFFDEASAVGARSEHGGEVNELHAGERIQAKYLTLEQTQEAVRGAGLTYTGPDDKVARAAIKEFCRLNDIDLDETS